MKRDELRKMIAKSVCRVHLNGGDPDQYAARWNNAEIEMQDFPAWRDYLPEADAVLAALDAAGLVVVPRKMTGKMIAVMYQEIIEKLKVDNEVGDHSVVRTAP